MQALSGSFFLEGDGLPADAAAVRFEAVEAISEPYSVRIELATAEAGFRVETCMRRRLRLVVRGERGERRLFEGVVDRTRFVRVAAAGERHFELRLRPALAALEHREGCRIFQEKNVVQVVQTLFEEAGFGAQVVWRLAKTYEPREFIVQYNESHLNFVSRLLEENGIFYYFRHGEDGGTLVAGDSPAAFSAAEGAAAVILAMAQGGEIPGAEPLIRFSRTRAIRTSSVRLLDYDFEQPQCQPDASQGASNAWSMPYFEYPGGFTKGSVGARLCEARLHALRSDADICEGESRTVGLCVGGPFIVEGAAEPCLNGEFVVTRLVTRGQQTLVGGAGNIAVENRFEGLPGGTPYAPPRRAHKPRIHGVQTAVVTGSSAQEQAIHVDRYGRIKVRFHWDRVGQRDHTSSCWLRVNQVALGGSMSLPRVGWEVAVAFVDGDPDRPVVLGRVYNAEKAPPYPLPAGKATGALKSMSSPGAGGFNEIAMGDSAGSQGLGIHAQRDLNVIIRHDKAEEIGVDEEQTITVNGSRTVTVDDSTTIAGDQTIDVGAVRSHHIAGTQSTLVGGNDTSHATANMVEKVDGDRTYTVGGNQITICNGLIQTVTGAFTRDVGQIELGATLGSINDNVAGAYDETVGAIKVQLVNGSHGEAISGDKRQSYTAGELHLTKGNMEASAGGNVTHMVGGLHYRKVMGDFVVQAPMVTLLGAVGTFRGAGAELKLGGGPVVLKAPDIEVKSGIVVKLSASMKLG